MAAPSIDVLVASVRWKHEKDFVAALVEEGHKVVHTTSASVARPYLNGEQAARLVVVGRELDDRNPFDLLFDASTQRQSAGRTAPPILLTQGITADRELVALLKQRGVTAYLDEGDDLPGHVRTASGLLFAKSRASVRYPFKRNATLTWEGGEVSGKTADLSAAGIGFVTTAKTARRLPPRGSRVSLLLILGEPTFLAVAPGDTTGLDLFAGAPRFDADSALSIPCVLNGTSMKSRFLGDIAFVGLGFDHPSEHVVRVIERELGSLARV